MLLSGKDDWKRLLSNDDEERLNDVLRNVQKYRGAYRNAKDVKTAQLWCAVLALRKENKALLQRIDRLKYLLDGIVERVRKQHAEERELVESLEKF